MHAYVCTGSGSLRRGGSSGWRVWVQMMSPATIFAIPLASSHQGRPWDVPGKRAARYCCRSRRRLDLKAT